MGPNVLLMIALSPAAQQLLPQMKLGKLSKDTLLALEFRGYRAIQGCSGFARH